MTPAELRRLSDKALRAEVARGIAAGRPTTGPLQVHLDITNTCNAACVTCWDHSPHLTTPRSPAWKRQRMALADVTRILDELERFGSVRAVVVSGMGDPLTHPDVYDILAQVKARGWHLTVLSNLVAADIEKLSRAGVDNLLVGVQGVTPETHSAFHPGWTELEFFRLCSYLRTLRRAGVSMRHVQVIDRHTAPEVPQMVDFGHRFGVERVNYKLASLTGGTEQVACTPEQLDALDARWIPAARERARELGVSTNLELFASQVRAARDSTLQTTDMDEVGCFMGHVYTRITVTQQVLYCCNTNVEVGQLDPHTSLDALWRGERWQALRERLAAREWFDGCERCGKFEQNVKWSRRTGYSASSPSRAPAPAPGSCAR